VTTTRNASRQHEDEIPNFLGPFVQGPRGGRFVYVNSGTLAGQADSCWTRRAKVGLKEISWDLVVAVLANPSSFPEAKITGRAKDGDQPARRYRC